MPHIKQTLPDGVTLLYVWFEAMHTRVDILLKSAGHAESELLGVADHIRQIISDLEKIGNRFDPASELSRINQLPAGEVAVISDTLYDMLSQCIDYYRRTDGLFDITVSTPGYVNGLIDCIRLDDENRFMKERSDIVLDLSGFIKGYALDRLRPYLERERIEDALVSLGNSSIMAMGDVPGPVKDGCMSTSGNADDSRCHIMNPRTGQYVKGLGSTQVITAGGAEGEVKATVEFLLTYSR